MLKIRIWQVSDWRLSRKFGTWERNLHRAVLERRLVQRLNPGRVGGFRKMRKPMRETRLAGWGGRIRTSEWRNQNPIILPIKSTLIQKNKRNCQRAISIAYVPIRNRFRLNRRARLVLTNHEPRLSNEGCLSRLVQLRTAESGRLFTLAVSIWSVYSDYGTQWQEVAIPSQHG